MLFYNFVIVDKRTQELLDRTFNFGVEVLIFLSKLTYNDVLSVPKKQLARAGTSIGANYEESQAA
jgi:four helix bundle protein